MRWNASGIKNTFEYEMVGVFSPHESLGFLDCVKSGTLTRNWDAMYRESLSLEIDGEEIPNDCLVRVWHIAENGGESATTLLGTFMQVSSNLSYKRGRYVGTVSFQSCLYRLGTDLRTSNRNVKANTNVVEWFEKIVTASGGTPLIDQEYDEQTVASKKFTKAHVWQWNESVLNECTRCADKLNGMVHTTAYGETIIKPYLTPSERDIEWILTSDDIITGMSRSNPVIVNKVGVKYTPEGSQDSKFAYAQLDSTDPWSFENIGRNATKLYEYTTMKGTLADKAKSLLAGVSRGKTWSVSMPYAPISLGSRGAFVYQDSVMADVITCDAIIGAMEISLNTAMKMELSLEEVA